MDPRFSQKACKYMFKSEMRQLKLSRNLFEVSMGQQLAGRGHSDSECDSAYEADVPGDDLLLFETDDF